MELYTNALLCYNKELSAIASVLQNKELEIEEFNGKIKKRTNELRRRNEEFEEDGYDIDSRLKVIVFLFMCLNLFRL